MVDKGCETVMISGQSVVSEYAAVGRMWFFAQLFVDQEMQITAGCAGY